jgi:hypothetical protein
MSAVYQSASIDLGNRMNIRLMKILFDTPQGDSSLIACRLHVVSLRDSPSYTALSYMWGPPAPARQILLNNELFTVRENLWTFLHQARMDRDRSLFWVDAICIDQTNNDERTHQVSVMGTIYLEAALAIAWLGLPTEQTAQWEMALDMIPQADSTKGHNFDIWLRENKHAMTKLCSHVYWSRVWIVQELVLAYRINLLCGKHRATHETLTRLGDQCSRRSRDIVPPDIWTSPGMRVLQRRSEWHQAIAQGLGLDPTLEHMIINFKHAQCMEPRDHVYALLSLCDPVELRERPVRPDYSIPAMELFIQLVKRAERNPYLCSFNDESTNMTLLDYASLLGRILGIEEDGLTSEMLLPST